MENAVALVSGAAGGIGAAVTEALGRQGAVIAAVDRDAGRLADVAAKCTASGLRVHPLAADVADRAGVDRLVADVEEWLGPVDFLVNAAGVLRLGELGALSDEDWAATFAVNVDGVFFLSRAVARRMVPRGRGAIVTVASNAAAVPRTEMGAYAASKAAATMVTKTLGLEVARYGVRCNVVAPGSTDTPMLTGMWRDEDGPRRTLDGHPEAYRVGIPLRKLARPDDVADAVVFLLSEQAGHITMHTLTVDGGAGLGV